MNGGIDPEPSGICDWCGVRYFICYIRARKFYRLVEKTCNDVLNKLNERNRENDTTE